MGRMAETRKLLEALLRKETGVCHGWLKLPSCGTGTPYRLPYIFHRGNKPRNVCLITAAIHGDERAGVGTVHLLSSMLRQPPGSVLMLPVVNMPGYLGAARFFSDCQDINHGFDKDILQPSQVIADALKEMMSFSDCLFDLHTERDSYESVCFVRADCSNPAVREMAAYSGAPYILHQPPSARTLRGYARSIGKPAVTLEIGRARSANEKYSKEVAKAIYGFIMNRRRAGSVVYCSASKWQAAKHGGYLNLNAGLGRTVSRGKGIGFVADIFGKRKEILSDESGAVLGHAADPVVSSGSKIIHVGRNPQKLATARFLKLFS